MKIKILGLVMALLLLGTLPITAAINVNENEPTPIFGKKTFIVGLITKPQMIFAGQYLEFKAIKVKYMVFGERRVVDAVGFQKIILPNDFRGYLGNHIVCAIFQGVPH